MRIKVCKNWPVYIIGISYVTPDAGFGRQLCFQFIWWAIVIFEKQEGLTQ